MSIANLSNVSTPTGILRRTPSRGRGGGHRNVRNDTAQHLGSPTSGTGVHFAVPENLSELLQAASSKKEEGSENQKTNEELQGLLTHLRNARGTVLIDWLKQIQKNVSSLKPKMENFVLSLLRLGWADQSEEVGLAYKEFLVDLVTAQGYYTKPVLKMLVSNLSGIADCSTIDGEDRKTNLKDLEALVFDNTHEAIRSILKVAPLAGRNALLQYIRECQPYALTLKTYTHTHYIENILKIADYAGQDEDGVRIRILNILTERLVFLDVHIDRNSNDCEDDNCESKFNEKNMSSMKNHSKKHLSLAAKSNLNAAMRVLFQYINKNVTESVINPVSAHIYQDFLSCFESYVLTAKDTGHVQFLMFFLIGTKNVYSDLFLKWLWDKFTSPNTPSIWRQSSISYMASFVSRAVCVNKVTLMAWLRRICAWIHLYIDQSWSSKSPNTTSDAHGAFYAACQAVFYMFVFRQDEFKDSKIAYEMLSKLSLQKVVTCHLNPLRFCLPAIARNFSSVANHFQLAYCETIIQRNARLHLPIVSGCTSSVSNSANYSSQTIHAFFPFDPYTLKDSKHFLQVHYRQYNGNIVIETEDSSSEEEFLEEEARKTVDDDESEDDAAEIKHKIGSATMTERGDCGAERSKRRRLSSSCKSATSKNLLDFGYSFSPGFKQ